MHFNNYNQLKLTNLLLIIHFFTFISCKTSRETTKNEVVDTVISGTNNNVDLATKCPEEGVCSVRLFKNKGINLRTLNNHLFYDIVDNNSKTVVQFQYSANQDQVAIDGGYRESVIFEISNNVEQLDLNDFDLQKSNMIYARYCNCRGKAGIFKVTSGKLKLLLKNDEVNFTLDFALNENPPLIDHIYVQKNKVK